MRNLHRRSQLVLEQLEVRCVLSAIATTSTNWSGYAVQATAASVSAVSASWTVPTVTGTGTAYSSTWVGIDGWKSSTVEQIGTDSDIVNGKAVYYAWYEMYPNYAVNIAMTVKPGDAISASVTYVSTTNNVSTFTLQITDTPVSGTATTYTTTQTISGAQRSSAEWIQEAPSSSFGVLKLANFGTVNFTNAQATIGGVAGPIDNTTWTGTQVYSINMTSRTGATQDKTSALTDATGTPTTSSFSVTFVASTVGSVPPRRRWRAPEEGATQNFAAIAVDVATGAQSIGTNFSSTTTLSAPSITLPAQTALPTPAASPTAQFGTGTVGGSRTDAPVEVAPTEVQTPVDTDDSAPIGEVLTPSLSRSDALMETMPSALLARDAFFAQQAPQRPDVLGTAALAGQPDPEASNAEITGAALVAVALSSYWELRVRALVGGPARVAKERDRDLWRQLS